MTEPEKFPKKQMNFSPLVSLLAIISATFIIFAFLNEFAVKTPLVRSFDDAAKQAEIAACESKLQMLRANAICVWGDRKW